MGVPGFELRIKGLSVFIEWKPANQSHYLILNFLVITFKNSLFHLQRKIHN
jgi:hypothetical protein